MCDSPIKIPNKNRFKEKRFRDHSIRFQPWKDYTSEYIEVPCGHCRSCIRQKQDGLVQRVQLESQKNHLFMCTLTYQPKYLPVYEVGNYKIRYADSSHVQKMMKMLKKDNAFGIPFRYLVVSELGSQRGRPHFHILFLFPKSYFPDGKEDYIAACESFASKSRHYFTCLNYWRVNLGSRRVPDWQPLTRYVEKYVNGQLRKNYDFHYINPFLTKNGVEDCGMYVLKYMFKPSDRAVRLQQALKLNLTEAEYAEVWRVVRPKYFASVGFGLNARVQLRQKVFDVDQDIIDKLEKDIAFSRENLDYPAYVHPFTGKLGLISPYYLHRTDIYSEEDRFHFWIKSGKSAPGVPEPTPYSLIPSYTKNQSNSVRYEKTSDHVDGLGVDADFELLD